MPGAEFDRRKIAIYLGLGVGLAASTGFFMALGYLLDRRTGTSPAFTVLGAFLGGALGFYNLYRQALAVENGPPGEGDDDGAIGRPGELPEDRTEERGTP